MYKFKKQINGLYKTICVFTGFEPIEVLSFLAGYIEIMNRSPGKIGGRFLAHPGILSQLLPKVFMPIPNSSRDAYSCNVYHLAVRIPRSYSSIPNG